MNIFDGHLKAVKETCFSHLDLLTKPFNQIFIDNSIGCGKECQNVLDEIALVFVQFRIPMIHIFRQINFFHRPEWYFSLNKCKNDKMWRIHSINTFCFTYCYHHFCISFELILHESLPFCTYPRYLCIELEKRQNVLDFHVAMVQAVDQIPL